MGRKNKRRGFRTNNDFITDLLLKPEPEQHTEPHIPRCSFCGRKLYPGTWHWMYDEFGQRVRKCNDERTCQENRRPECEESFRKAMRM